MEQLLMQPDSFSLSLYWEERATEVGSDPLCGRTPFRLLVKSPDEVVGKAGVYETALGPVC